MSMRKIIVIGSPGAGKSTFARALRDKTGLPLYHLDMLWHLPDGTHVEREEFDRRLAEVLARGEWIIDGNYQRTLRPRFERCDTVFLLDYPTEVCLEGAAARVGKPREDMPWQETELDDEFRRSIEAFPTEQLPTIYELLREYENSREIHIFRSRADADEWLSEFDRSRSI